MDATDHREAIDADLARLETYIYQRLNVIGYVDYRTVLHTVSTELAELREKIRT